MRLFLSRCPILVPGYTGDYHWRVAEVKNSKLHVGDTFSCRVIAQKQPLVVDHLHTSDSDYEGYMLGGKNGLTIVERLSI